MKRKMKKKIVIITAVISILGVAGIITVTKFVSDANDKSQTEITESEMQKYKDMIGSSMDVKKSILILFNSYDECMNFITEHGGKDNPHEQGKGAVAYMADGYYNIVGKPKLEEFFDSASDGEYTKEPIEYSGMYCYLKRLSVDSIIENEEELKKLIIQDKEQAEKIKK